MTRIAGLWPLALGVVVGGVGYGFSAYEARWIVYAVLGAALAVTIVALPERRTFFLGAFVLSLQADVSIRFLHGHAGSHGLVFPLPFMMAVGLIAEELRYPDFRQRARLWGGALTLPIVALLGTSVLSLLTTSEQFVGLSQFTTELELVFLYWVGANAVRSEKDLRLVFRLLLVVLGIQAVVYVIQSRLGISFDLVGVAKQLGDLPRPGGTVSTHPAGFGSFVLPILFMALAQFMVLPKRRQKGLAVLIALSLVSLALTYTRACWGAFMIGFTVLVVLAGVRRLLRPDRMMKVAVAGVVATVLLLPLVAARLTQSPLDESYAERVALMRMAQTVIVAHPISGVGPGAYRHTYRGHLSADFDGFWSATVHNAYLLRAAETGILGGAMLVILLASAIVLGVRLTKLSSRVSATAALGITAGICALAFEMYWDMWRGFCYNAMLWFILGILEAIRRLALPGSPAAAGAANRA